MTCPKCHGVGVLSEYYHVQAGVCFLCGGSGSVTKEQLRLTVQEKIEQSDTIKSFLPMNPCLLPKYTYKLIAMGDFPLDDLFESMIGIVDDTVYYIVTTLPVEEGKRFISWIDEAGNMRDDIQVAKWRCDKTGVNQDRHGLAKNPESQQTEVWMKVPKK